MGFNEACEAVPEKYRQYCLRYEELRNVVRELADGASLPNAEPQSRDFMNSEMPVHRFQERLQSELTKVNHFACIKHEDLFLGLRRVCEDCIRFGGRGRSGSDASGDVDRSAHLAAMHDRITAMGQEVVYLDTYVRLNYMGFQKITRKFDQSFGVTGSALFISSLKTEPFCTVKFDDILILLGLAWARWRALQSAAEQSKDATWKPPESFVRNTAKYWVKPDKVTLLKTRILKHLPYLIFGASQSEQEKLLEPFALLDLDYKTLDVQAISEAYSSGSLEESQLLSSVYFDSPDATCYQERIKREEGARLVRFRWYGENLWEGDHEIYVERKIHHEGWGSAQSAKERCIVPQRDIFSFMKGKFDIDAYFERLKAEGMYSEKARKAMKGIAHEVNSMIQGKGMQPIVRTSYYRCAFQLSTSNEVRISLDTQMTLLNEFRGEGHASEPWCRVSSDKLGEDEVYRFPFAILEIKLQNVSETPLWLRQTLAEIEAIQVHKFSKFQHGMAFLHPERVPILPHWHQDFLDWHEQKARNADFTNVRNSQDDDDAVPLVRTQVAPGGEGHHLKDMENLDPKAVFANERTLLHYAEKGMYTGMLAVVMLAQEGAVKSTGVILSVSTGLFFVWALCEYFFRLQRISGRASVAKSSLLRLDVAHGPLFVGMLVLLVLVLSVVNSVAQTGKS